MSVMRPVLNLWLRLTEKPHLARAATPERLRRSFEMKARLFFRAPRGTVYHASQIIHEDQGLPVLHISPARPGDGPVILYFHGGGYVFGSPHTHKAMVARLCAETGLRAVLPDYRKAPEHAFPAAIEDALAAYMAVADHPGGVVIGGDSAGGGMALALLGEITRLGARQPAGVFAFSPLTDQTYCGGSIITNAKADVVLPARRVDEMAGMYLQGQDAGDPRASPLRADFTGACPVWLTVGDTEILLDDTRRMAAALRGQGVEVSEHVEHDLPHVWPLFHNLLPEARVTLRDLGRWITSLSRP